MLAVSLAPAAAQAQADESTSTAQANSLADEASSDVDDVAAAFDGLVAGEDYVAGELLVMGRADAAALAALDGAEGLSAADGVDVSAIAELVGATVGEVIPAAGASELSVASADATSDAVLSDGDVAVLELPDGSDIVSAARAIAAAAPSAAVQPNYLLDLIDGDETSASDLPSTAALPDGAASETAVATADLGINPFASLAFIPNDPALQSSSESWQLSLVGAYSAWSSARVNHAATVAVIDSGVLATHEDLSGVLDVENAYNSCTMTAGIDACEDTVGHGTHVAGAIGAVANNDLGTVGVSYGARVLPIKCTYARGSGESQTKASTSAVVEGIRYALTKDVQVINLSIGSYSGNEVYLSAVEEAIAANVSVVCAAGNNASSRPYYPADFDGVVSVTAVDSTGAVASFSNYNEHKTLAAPGVNVYGLKSGDTASYGTMSGTSMAAPIVSGCVALLRVANPHITAKEAEQALISTAKDAGDAGFDPYYGWGIVQVDQAVKEVTADPVRGFTDMESDAWYTTGDDFGYAVSMGFISGYAGSTTFGPYDGITRGQVATILWRIAGQPEAAAAAFDDVDYDAYYGGAIAWARSTSVVSGYSGTNDFGPDMQVTRQELACMLANYASVAGGIEVSSTCAALDELPDASSVESWARASVGWCMDEGIISGVDSGAGERLACPYDSAWRASVACMAATLQRDVLEK